MLVFSALGLMAQSTTASFTASGQAGCAPYSVNFTNASSNAVSYNWNFGNGNFSTLPNPQNVFVNPGTYTVTLTATGAGGQTSSETMSISALPGPVTSFTIAENSGCEDQTVFNFNNTSTGAVSVFWDFDDGTSSLQSNPTKIYDTPGIYHVSLLATNSVGCQSVYNLPQPITINPVPVAAFTVNATSVCQPSTPFLFTSTSTGASSFLWNFGDGTTSTQANPGKIYSNPGVYTVSLVAGNGFGCFDTITQTNLVTVQTPVYPQITTNVTSGCQPLFINYNTNQNIGAVSYQWNFGNGQQSQAPAFNVNYLNAGNYDITLSATMANGCVYTTTQNDLITVHPQPAVNFTVQNASGCAPLTIGLDNLTTGAVSYYWQFSDGTNSAQFEPSHIFTQSGLHWVRLTATSNQGCVALQTQLNSVNAIAPVAGFSVSDTSNCPPLTATFTNQTTGATSYQWIFGNGTTSNQANPTITLNQLGHYDVTLIAINSAGCRDTLFMNDLLDVEYTQANYNPPPPVSACAPFNASFDLGSQSANSYLWDFGDGTTSTDPSPNHVYGEPGDYTVSLLINNGTPCMLHYPVFQQVHIEGSIPEFTVTYDACPPFPVTFNVDTNFIESFAWDFGDGTTSTEALPTHTYPNNNIHHVSLNVVTDLGCTYSFVGFNAVNFGSLFANFTSYYDPEAPFPLEVAFTSNNSSATGWLWNFGDGTTSTQENPTHIYQTDGDYVVTLTITTANCTLSSFGSAFADEAVAEDAESASGGSEPPGSAIQVEPMAVCAPTTIHFFRQDTSHVVQYWNLGDGTISTLQTPVHLYTQAGTYNVIYVADTPYGVDTFNYPQTILVGGGVPNFSIDHSQSCTYTEVTVNPENPGIIDSLTWTFSDGFTSNDISVTHQFQNSNSSYLVQLSYTDTLGCVANRMRSIFANPTIPDIDYATAVCNDTVHFTHDLPSSYSLIWDFGDGTTSNDFEPSHFYTASGTYTPSLQYTDGAGCQQSFTLPQSVRVVILSANLEVNGTASGCAPLNVDFNNLTTGGYSQAFSPYFFVWGDGVSSWSNDPNKTYSNPGVYDVELRVYNTSIPGCSDTIILQDAVTVYGADADFSFTQSGLCIPIQAQFTSLSTEAVEWNWDFGNGYTSTLQNPSINFVSEPADSVTLSITTIHGCTASHTEAGINILEPVIGAAYSGICNPLQVQFSATTDGMIGWEWDFGDGTTGSGPAPAHVYTADGNYAATVIVTTIENCRDTVTMQVPILVNGPEANFNSPTPANCAPSVVEFFDQSEEAVAWFWDFGDNTNSTVQHPVKLYDQPGVYDILLVVTSTAGCVDSLFMPEYVTVLGPATSFSVSSQSACIGSPVQFTDLSNGSVEWEWNFGEGNTSAEQNPTFTYQDTGSYIVTLFSADTLGCSAFYTIALPIHINPYPVASFTVSDMSQCAPLTVDITNTSTGATSYNWNLGGLSTSTAVNPSVEFSLPGTYRISMVATTEFGCSDTFSISGLQSLIVPIAGFNITETEGCTPLFVTFNNTSYQTENPSYNWAFGNGNSSAEINPTHVYFDPGFYTVGLEVINQNGCADTLSLPSFIQVYDTLPAPPTPILRVSVTGPESVVVDWEQSVAPDFGAYELYGKNQTSSDWVLLTTIDESHILSYTQTGLNTFENVYCYRLVTRDRCGYTVDVENLIDHCTINIEVITLENNTIDAVWSPYVGKTVSQYRVFRAEENGDLPVDLGTVPGDVLRFTDSTIYCPSSYRYFVKAEGLNGQFHVESDSDFDLSDPIDNLFENQQVDMARSTVINDESILTEWPVPEIMGNRVTGYEVYRSTDNVHFTLVTTVPSYQTEYVDHQVNVFKNKYYYAVLATNACDLRGREGESSDNIVLKAEARDDLFINLEWTPYEGWGAHGVGFYMIERQNSDGSWEVIKTVPGTVLTTVDEN
jgi:PKD repeat protein